MGGGIYTNTENIIKKIREEKGLSTYQLAKIITDNGYKISQSAISKIENGKRKVDMELLDKLTEALDISWADLLDDKKQREEFKTLEKNNAIKTGIYNVYLEIIQDIISKLIKHTITNYGSVELNEEQIDNISSNVVKLMKENISNELKTFMDK
jgi:transcriptional regulator with XRE-family HTH domain